MKIDTEDYIQKSNINVEYRLYSHKYNIKKQNKFNHKNFFKVYIDFFPPKKYSFFFFFFFLFNGNSGYKENEMATLQYSCLENPMNRGALWATVHGVAKSQT